MNEPANETASARAANAAAALVRVALVDDHAVVRQGYRRLLESEADMQVVAEHGDADAANAWLVRTEAEDVDVLVLDLAMPGRDGLDFARRCALRWPRLRVLVFTMHDHPSIVAQALAAGAAGFVTKTSAPEVLVASLRSVASGRTRVLSPDVALRIDARADAAAGAAPPAALSAREFDVMRLLVAGEALDAIARRLHLSPKTVSNLQTAVRNKLGVRSAVELLRYAQQHGLG
jgi:DNA-binding NarL/FixJ family response regulator